MIPPGEFLLILAGTLACLFGATVIFATLVGDALNERDRRREASQPARQEFRPPFPGYEPAGR